MQKHHCRPEHWIVVKVAAEIINGYKIFTLSKNQSTYISLGEIHRLTNPGVPPSEIIEIQLGRYLVENDIIRLDECWGREI